MLWVPSRVGVGTEARDRADLSWQEMIIDKAEGKDVPRYLIYDIVRIEVRLPGGLGRGLTDWDVAGAGGGQDGLQRTPHLHLEGDLRAPQAGHEGGPHRPQQGALWGATEGLLGPHLHRVGRDPLAQPLRGHPGIHPHFSGFAKREPTLPLFPSRTRRVPVDRVCFAAYFTVATGQLFRLPVLPTGPKHVASDVRSTLRHLPGGSFF